MFVLLYSGYSDKIKAWGDPEIFTIIFYIVDWRIFFWNDNDEGL